jgi:hypothetical protein
MDGTTIFAADGGKPLSLENEIGVFAPDVATGTLMLTRVSNAI